MKTLFWNSLLSFFLLKGVFGGENTWMGGISGIYFFSTSLNYGATLTYPTRFSFNINLCCGNMVRGFLAIKLNKWIVGAFLGENKFYYRFSFYDTLMASAGNGEIQSQFYSGGLSIFYTLKLTGTIEIWGGTDISVAFLPSALGTTLTFYQLTMERWHKTALYVSPQTGILISYADFYIKWGILWTISLTKMYRTTFLDTRAPSKYVRTDTGLRIPGIEFSIIITSKSFKGTD